MSTSKTITERFWEHVDKHGPLPSRKAILLHPEISGTRCWIWTGAKDRDGYGQFSADGKSKKAHRISWFLEYGVWPAHMSLHKCDFTRCVRNSHLYEGTSRDNSNDMLSKGRAARGIKHWKAKLTERQVIKIRSLYETGMWTQKQLAEKYKVNQVSISAIVRRTKWRHI